jgi:DNA mismatch repair protein MutL
MKESVFMIDKHAAHERILFNKLKKEQKVEVQPLLTPVSVTLAREEYDAVINNTEALENAGFEVEDFGSSCVLVRAVPTFLTSEDASSVISEIASKLISGTSLITERQEHILSTVACKAAIKAGGKTSILEMQSLAEKVLLDDEIMYCPHGRPVAFEIKKRELEKQFGRIQ